MSISETVLAPGSRGKLCALQASIIKRVVPGLTAKRAPALAAECAFISVNIVPAPTQISGNSFARRSIEFKAASVRSVTSIVLIPPESNASPSGTAKSASSITITGITGPVKRISEIFMYYVLLLN